MSRFAFSKRSLCQGLVLTAMLGWLSGEAFAVTRNGFDLDGALVPAEQILHGGPPRDGIPAIDDPKFVAPGAAAFLQATDRVLGIARNGIAKAYPIAILNWHEIVNDRFADEGIVVTFCPLCGTGMAFKSDIDGKRLDFGVSGLLYNSDVLLYDRDSESLWSQIARQAVSGPMKHTRLQMVPVSHTSWADWRERHPDTQVLSTETGHLRDYGRDPYAGYQTSPATIFPVSFDKGAYHPKELVIGLELQGAFKAYPFVELAKSSSRISDTVAGQAVTVVFDAEHRSGQVFSASGDEIPTVIAFWFAWSAFHPDTQVYRAP